MTSGAASRFETDTALRTTGPGGFEATIDRGWWIERGPNGGYLAAILLRAATEAVADPTRRPRSLSIHYLAPPTEGPVALQATIERAGRSLTSVSVRMSQGGATLAIALAALATDRVAPAFVDLAMPEVPPPDACPPPTEPSRVPIGDRWSTRFAIGDLPFTGGHRARTGGWLRLDEPAPIDAHVVAAMTDGWMPAIFTRLSDFAAVPTVDLTVHFREPTDGLGPEDWCLASFRTNVSAGGFIEEDGEIWSRDGRLLAQSRQLAVYLPL